MSRCMEVEEYQREAEGKWRQINEPYRISHFTDLAKNFNTTQTKRKRKIKRTGEGKDSAIVWQLRKGRRHGGKRKKMEVN